jgi:hypothetical protein
LYAFLISLMHRTCPAHLILLDFTTLISSTREEYKLRSSSLCSFLHPSLYSSHQGPNILHSTLRIQHTTVHYQIIKQLFTNWIVHFYIAFKKPDLWKHIKIDAKLCKKISLVLLQHTCRNWQWIIK